MAAKFDARKYGERLAEVQPTVIESDEEKDRVMAVILDLMDEGENMSPESEALLRLMSKLVEDYEAEHYYIEPAPPNVVLQTLMEERGLRQRDLVGVFRHKGLISEVLKGKRGISKRLACDLADFFNVSPELFLWEDYGHRNIGRKQRLRQDRVQTTEWLSFNFEFDMHPVSQEVNLQLYTQAHQIEKQSVTVTEKDEKSRGKEHGTITVAA